VTSFAECRFTAKGVEWVAGEIAKHKAVSAIEKNNHGYYCTLIVGV